MKKTEFIGTGKEFLFTDLLTGQAYDYKLRLQNCSSNKNWSVTRKFNKP